MQPSRLMRGESERRRRVKTSVSGRRSEMYVVALTRSGRHPEVSDAGVEKDERQSLLLELVRRGLVDSVTGGLEVSSRDDLKSLRRRRRITA